MTTRGERVVAMRDWGYATATITRNEAGLRDRQKTVTGEPENRMGSDATGSNNGDGSAVAIRPSATVIIVRGAKESPSILMGQRSRSAVFMPDKFVFPGGAVDPADRLISLSCRGGDPSLDKLGLHSGDLDPRTIILSGIREVWEETGLLLATRDGAEDGQSVSETQQGPAGRCSRSRMLGRIPGPGHRSVGSRHEIHLQGDHSAGASAPIRRPVSDGRRQPHHE